MADLVAGHVTWTIEGLTVLKPFVQDGRLRALAVTTTQRAKTLPDIPTMAEAGVPGSTSRHGPASPRRRARPSRSSTRSTPRSPASWRRQRPRAWFESFGVDPGGDRPEAFAAVVRAEHAKLGEVIRTMGLKLD